MDIEFIRENPEKAKQALRDRNEQDVDIDKILALDKARREAITEADSLKNRRNVVSKEIGELKKKGEDGEELIKEMREVGQRIKALDEHIIALEAELEDRLLRVPNLPLPDVPVGPDESHNVEIKRIGKPRKFDFEPKAHWDIGVDLDILDFETAAKITGARFVVNKGLGATLERALINFMLDLHTTEHGYQEIFPPIVVHERSLVATGQLPKFKDTVFKLEGSDFYLNPTAEVPVTNIHRDTILDEDDLPLYYTAYAPSFRNEAFSHGRDTRGLIRMYQFNKVELVKFVKPEESPKELDRLIKDAGEVLERLGLPYRIVQMCTGDLGISAAKKFDLEVWMPSYSEYVEISSCSTFTDFQARRGRIRYRTKDGKTRYCHTLNGSGLAIGRTVAAVLENYQQEDGTVLIPEALRPYMHGLTRIG